jgi:excisionase family DNA binding protein
VQTAKLTLTVGEAAEVLGISRAHAYRCVKNGELRAVQLGRRLVVPVAAVGGVSMKQMNAVTHYGTSPRSPTPSSGSSRAA